MSPKKPTPAFGKKPFKKGRKPFTKSAQKPVRKPRPPKHTPAAEQQPINPIFEVEITVISEDGEPFAYPQDLHWRGMFPRILVDPKANVTVGDVLTIEIISVDEEGPNKGTAFAQPVRLKEPEHTPTFIAQLQDVPPCFVRPFHRDLQGADFFIAKEGVGKFTNLAAQTVVRVAPLGQPKRGNTPVKIVEVLAPNANGMESAIALENHSIPIPFTPEAESYTQALKPFTAGKNLDGREDLRNIPMVTIDGADAKDFDDAVWAEAWMQNKDAGHHIIVAIADVAHYLAPASPLDEDASTRGNSTYLPDTVVPMLPEKLSNNLCSLVPQEDRPVLAVHLYINSKGQLKHHTFTRAVIHSHARLTYEQAQTALDGDDKAVEPMILENTLRPLQKAALTLLQERQTRHALELDLPEMQLDLAPDGTVRGIKRRERIFTHRLIEECMVLANVAAATALGTKSAPCVYRIHPEPNKEKLDNLRNLLKQHRLNLKTSNQATQADFARLTTALADHPKKDVLMRTILQTQQQAKYSPENVGHFGLALHHYAHFTSPIRRYSDVLVHRQLIATLNLSGQGGQHVEEKRLKSLCDHINITERRSQQAEWEARDRFTARFYHQHIGETFDAQIITIQKYGMFVRIDGIAEGLLPLRLMHDDHYIYNSQTQTLTGKRTKKRLSAGQSIKAKLVGADTLDGKLTFGGA